jgi:hypothetical protein
MLVATPATTKPVSNSRPQVDPAQAQIAVATCVDQVHKASYFAFDAYYNRQTQAVEDNQDPRITTPQDTQAKFVFRKCMAAQGYPMGSPANSN